MDLIQGQLPEGVEFGGGRRKSREGRRATRGLTDGFNLLNEKVQKTLGRWTSFDDCHSIQPHDGGEGTPQFTRLARVFRNTGQPVAVLPETVGLVASSLVMNPEQPIRDETRTAIATLERPRLPTEQSGFVVR